MFLLLVLPFPSTAAAPLSSYLLLPSTAFRRSSTTSNVCLRHSLQSSKSIVQTPLQAVRSRALLACGALRFLEAASLSAHPTLLAHKKIAFLQGHFYFYLPIEIHT